MRERRGTGGVKDVGARTRRTDHGASPHVISEWLTTFNLRWVQHLNRRHGNGRRLPTGQEDGGDRAEGLAGA